MWFLSLAVAQTCSPRGHSAGQPSYPAGMPGSCTPIWSHLEEQDAALEPTKQTPSDTGISLGGGGRGRKPATQHKKEYLKRHFFENKGSSGLGGHLWLKPTKKIFIPLEYQIWALLGVWCSMPSVLDCSSCSASLLHPWCSISSLSWSLIFQGNGKTWGHRLIMRLSSRNILYLRKLPIRFSQLLGYSTHHLSSSPTPCPSYPGGWKALFNPNMGWRISKVFILLEAP